MPAFSRCFSLSERLKIPDKDIIESLDRVLGTIRENEYWHERLKKTFKRIIMAKSKDLQKGCELRGCVGLHLPWISKCGSLE